MVSEKKKERQPLSYYHWRLHQDMITPTQRIIYVTA